MAVSTHLDLSLPLRQQASIPGHGEALARLVRLGARFLQAPIALIVSESGELLAAEFAPDVPVTEAEALCREVSARVAASGTVGMADDLRGADSPLATALLGIPFTAPAASGTFCVLDLQPRSWSPDEIALLEELTRSVEAALAPADPAAREREERYRRIVETASEGLWISDATGRITYVNEQAARMLGHTAPEICGRRIHDFVPEEDHPHLDTRLARRRQGITERYDARCRHRDGSEVWVLISASPLLSDGGEYLGTLAMLTDFTARRQAEEALRESEARFRAIFGEAGIGVALVDFSGSIVESNRSLQQWLGYTGAELTEIGIGGITHPEDLAKDLHLFQELTSGLRNTYQIEKRYLRKDGRVVWGRLTGSIVRSGSEEPQFGVGMVEDITEHKRSEERNAEFYLLGQSLNLASSPREAALIVLDVADRLLGWDACWVELIDPSHREALAVVCFDEIHGVRTEVPGVSMDSSVSPFTLEAIEEGPVLLLREPDRLPRIDAPGMLPMGDVARPSASIMCVPIRTAARAVGALSIQSYTFHAYDQRDVETLQALADYCAGAFERTQGETARQALQAQLSQSQKMEAIGRLAGGVAHDFNNMLGVINGYSELLLGRPDLPLNTRTPVQEILGAGKRAASLTRQLLAFSRKEMIRPQALDLGELVRNTHRMLRRLIGEDIELAIPPTQAPAAVKADPGQLEQVLLNLAINARDAMPRGGRLAIDVKTVTLAAPHPVAGEELPVGSYVRLTVKDSGSGMDPETRAHIFEPFYTTKPVGQGTGLGLATVYGIVKQNGGYIEVESERGRGTTFRIYLPCLETPEPGGAHDVDPDRPPGKETILVVEDEAMLRRLSSEILRMSGYEVLEAANTDEALKLCGSHAGRIHLLLTDVVMPGRSGRELAVLATAADPALRVIYMSGYTDDAVVRHGVHSAEVYFLQKPFTPAVLTQKVREVLDL